MARDTTHELQPRCDHDGLSRRLAVLACKQAIRGSLEPRLKNEFEASGGTEFQSLPHYPYWSSINRAAQDRMWAILSEQIDEDYGRIDKAARQLRESAQGSFEAGSAQVPAYQKQTAIHGQPGGYMLDRGAGDLAAGILYEAGGNLYALGQGIGARDSKGQRLIAWVREQFPDLKPRRILEMGCSAGGQSADYPEQFPEAECHAIDLSPAMIRYAHARTEALGARLHFHQADAARTGFEDDTFDLVVSHNMFHEVAADHMPAIMAECRRVLAPGGVVIHQDVPIQIDRLDSWMKAISAWQKDNNDEPFWMDFATADLPAMLVAAGFEPGQVRSEYLKALDGPIPWYVVSARKTA